jgi:hypothetical protein
LAGKQQHTAEMLSVAKLTATITLQHKGHCGERLVAGSMAVTTHEGTGRPPAEYVWWLGTWMLHAVAMNNGGEADEQF